MRKKIPQLYVEKRLSFPWSYQLFLVKKQHLAKKTLTHQVFVMKINHRNHQASGPRLQGPLPGKHPLSRWVRESDSFQFTDGVYVIMQFKEKFYLLTFQDVWWVRISITTHYNSIHMIINCPLVLIDGGTLGKHLENKLTSSWRASSRLFRSRNAGFLCELHSGLSLRWRCFALCESPSAEN